jgi:FOG: FHA domain
VLNHAIVSRKHARIELRGHRAWVIDLNSRNGVTVNRLRVKEEQLNDGDVIGIGPGTELEFVIMVIAVSCVKLLSAHNSTQHTSRKHKV